MSHRSEEPDDATLVERVLAGEREMFAALLRRHYESASRLCERILGSEGDARDAAQEAALQAFLGLERLREPSRFGAWFHSIAANLARSSLRRRRMFSLESLGERARGGEMWMDTSPTPEEVRLARELHDAVIEALEGLSEVNREAVVGYYLEGYGYAELAELLGVPVSTVKGRLYKGRRQLESPLAPVAKEILGTQRKEKRMDGRDVVEVVVAEVARVEPCDERGEEMMRSNPMMFPEFPFSEGDLESAVALLREEGGEKILPIYVGMGQGYSIWVSVSGERTPRPITHDLIGQILDTANLRIENVSINRLAEQTFYAEISLSHDGRSHRIDSRPSDALALAVRLEAPIFASRAVFDEAALDSRQAWLDHQREVHGLREKN